MVGGGTFLWADSFPAWLAWEAFEEKNGAASFEEMRRRIERYRRAPISATGVEPVGCIVVGEPFFLDEASWIPQPSDWSANIVQGKTYDESTAEGAALIGEVLARRPATTVSAAQPVTGPYDIELPGPVFGEPGLAKRRLGQGAFKLILLDAYGRRCAVTGEKLEGTLAVPPLDAGAFERWLRAAPALTLDGGVPQAQDLQDRIARFWLPDEVAIYIGMASSLESRVGDYYATPIGARRPHAGGYFLKLLSNIRDLHVHYASCPDPARAEDAMLGTFCRRVSETTLAGLADPLHPFPFANLEWPPGTRKGHGIRGARAPHERPPMSRTGSATLSITPPAAAPRVAGRLDGGPYRTQRVTEADLRAGQIRIPTSTPTKMLFPEKRTNITVDLRGIRLVARWDPRTGPDRERSGVMRFRDKEALRASVGAEETLRLALVDGELRIS